MNEYCNKLALRPREAAKMLSISERTLWTLTKLGRIPCVKLGTGKTNAVLYPVASLRQFLAQMAGVVEPQPAPSDATNTTTKQTNSNN